MFWKSWSLGHPMMMEMRKQCYKNEMVLAQLKEMDGHATYNVFKRWQNVINKISIPLIGPRPVTPPMVYEFKNELTFITSFSLGLSSRHSVLWMAMHKMKVKML